MAAGKTITGEDNLGKDGTPGGDSDSPDVKKYVEFVVVSTNHLFVAQENKYKDVLSVLGLKKPTPADRENARKLKRGTGYVQVAVALDSGATLRLVCDPAKIGDFAKLRAKKVHGIDVKHSYLPKTQSNR